MLTLSVLHLAIYLFRTLVRQLLVCLIVERRSGRRNHQKIYAGGSASSWKFHPCQTGQRVRARRSVVSGPLGWGLGVVLTTTLQKIYCKESTEKAKIHTGVLAPVKNKKNYLSTYFARSLLNSLVRY
jgi:hypothetical protein